MSKKGKSCILTRKRMAHIFPWKCKTIQQHMKALSLLKIKKIFSRALPSSSRRGLPRPGPCGPRLQFLWLLQKLFFTEVRPTTFKVDLHWLFKNTFRHVFLEKPLTKTATQLLPGVRKHENNTPDNISQQNVILKTKTNLFEWKKHTFRFSPLFRAAGYVFAYQGVEVLYQ